MQQLKLLGIGSSSHHGLRDNYDSGYNMAASGRSN